MKKLKPMLLVMIAAFLMFSFSSNAFAGSKQVYVTKAEDDMLVRSEKLYIDNEEVELSIDMMAAGEASVYLLFEDAETEDTILMSQLILRPEMKSLNIRSHHKNPRPGYYYIQISGDNNAFVIAQVRTAFR
ncbi:hypothetical protein GNQ08_14850 [Paenibacillus macerans]|uniref:Uncharacterized protein n=2 Tax=Paenibacillus macerans TaxID=44252 RepID=A0A6N8EXZ9_PAEMA|nr:hypothetical protein [Paenibacillus macerans]MUG23670.1 hypothetical protein [Paenibacillus macerans]